MTSVSAVFLAAVALITAGVAVCGTVGVSAGLALATSMGVATAGTWRTAYAPTAAAVARQPVAAIAVRFCSDFVRSLGPALIAMVLGTVVVWAELNLGGGPRPALR